MAYLTNRILTPEQMDADDVPADQLRSSLGFIRGVNRWLGGSRAVIGHLRRWSKAWPKDQPIRILDVATGSADIPLAIVRWAKHAGFDVRVTGLDRHATTLTLAAEHVAQESTARPDGQGVQADAALTPALSQRERGRNHACIQLIRADALHPPFPPNSFDYCITSMFPHHLPDLQVMTVLRIMDKLATRGIIWNDLIRSRMAYWLCKLITRFSDPMVRHDGPVSVLAGFSRKEVLDFRNRLGLLHLRYHRHPFYRFTLAGERLGQVSH